MDVIPTSLDRSAPPSILVIFGASGDLTRRKLLPAACRLSGNDRLPKQFALVGVARTPMSDEQFREIVVEASPNLRSLAESVLYVSGGYDAPATYERLGALLDELDQRLGAPCNRIFYLSTPPGSPHSGDQPVSPDASNDATASWYWRTSRPSDTSASSVRAHAGYGGTGTSPANQLTTSRPCSSRPRCRGAPGNRTRSRCRSSARTGSRMPGRRTVSPTRTTPRPASIPPTSDCSVMRPS